jgi:hypothetical protein
MIPEQRRVNWLSAWFSHLIKLHLTDPLFPMKHPWASLWRLRLLLTFNLLQIQGVGLSLGRFDIWFSDIFWLYLLLLFNPLRLWIIDEIILCVMPHIAVRKVVFAAIWTFLIIVEHLVLVIVEWAIDMSHCGLDSGRFKEMHLLVLYQVQLDHSFPRALRRIEPLIRGLLQGCFSSRTLLLFRRRWRKLIDALLR